MTMTRTIEARKTNAYTTVLLLEGGVVIGAWPTTGDDQAWASYMEPGDLGDWEATHPDETSPEAYGEVVRLWTYTITDNGREVENLDAGRYAGEEAALIAGEAAADDVCPQGSPNRRFVRVSATLID